MIGRAVRAAVATGENLTGLEQFRPLVQAGADFLCIAGGVWNHPGGGAAGVHAVNEEIRRHLKERA